MRYIESSALVAAALEGDPAAKASIRAPGMRITSAITIAGANRAIHRARLAERISTPQHRAALRTIASFARRCHILAVNDAVIARAGLTFPNEPVRTLDAIHLASMALLEIDSPQLIVVSRDVRVVQNATSLGYKVE